ncbi:MAG: hypothetical protein MUD03_16495 [Pirellula sp.]|nr:hypothetical protein [Pirellula sp.]
MSIVLAILAITIPPMLAIVIRNRVRAIRGGTIAFWILMVVGAQYSLATNSKYNSIAPGISVVAGWLPGVLYSGICVSIVATASAMSRRNESLK